MNELRGRPAIFVGGFNNPWSRRLTDQLRFRFATDSRYGRLAIRDSRDPDNESWSIDSSWPRWDVPQDYALITRVFDPITERAVVVAGGLAQYGTIAAAEFLTSSDYIAAALQGAPADWGKGNVQIVISTRVIRRESGPPQVVAVHFW